MNKNFITIALIIIMLSSVIGFLQWQYSFNTSKSKSFVRENTNNKMAENHKAGQDKLQNITQESEVTFLAVGDIMLSRTVADIIAKNGKDGLFPFRKLDSLLASTDFNFGNLESPYSGNDYYNPAGSLVFNAPTWTIAGLSQYNFKILNLANNHAMDQGEAALTYTKKYLADNFLTGIGVGANLNEAWEGGTFSTKGITVGFIGASYSSLNDNGFAKNNLVARIEDIPRLQPSIKAMKAKSDFVVVTMHAGTEYTRNPNTAQIQFAHAAIDAGADMIIGAHPHWVQTTEEYKGKYIFYSLGNFVFDQEWSQDTKEGLTLKITLNKTVMCEDDLSQLSSSKQQTATCSDTFKGNQFSNKATLKQIEMIPVIIENYSTPRIATETEQQNILKKINIANPIIKVVSSPD